MNSTTDILHVLVNPAAASGHGAKVWIRLRKKLKEKEVAYRAYIPAEKEEMAKLVQKLTGSGQECRLLILGGDGTLNLVMQNIVDPDHNQVFLPALL